MFSLFAGVRTRDHGIVPIAPNRGLPDDASDDALRHILGGWGDRGGLSWLHSDEDFKTVDQKVGSRNDADAFGFSWIGAAELLAVDYDSLITPMDDPTEAMPLREALGRIFFEHVEQLAKLGAPADVRLLFCFR